MTNKSIRIMTKEQAFAEIKKYEGMSDTDIISLGKKSIKAILDDVDFV